MMKKFIYITVAFMLMLIFIACSTMTPEQRKETYNLRQFVGDDPFVGSAASPYTYDKWGAGFVH
jgi:hypothetical protein